MRNNAQISLEINIRQITAGSLLLCCRWLCCTESQTLTTILWLYVTHLYLIPYQLSVLLSNLPLFNSLLCYYLVYDLHLSMYSWMVNSKMFQNFEMLDPLAATFIRQLFLLEQSPGHSLCIQNPQIPYKWLVPFFWWKQSFGVGPSAIV